MQIEITESDIELVCKALESYEREASSNSLMGEMLGAMFAGKITDPLEKAQMERDRDERIQGVQRETDVRKAKCLMLRARLTECRLRAGEFAR